MEGLGLRESPRRPPNGLWSGCAWWTSLRPASTADVITGGAPRSQRDPPRRGGGIASRALPGSGATRPGCLRGLGTRRNLRNGAAFNSSAGVPVSEVGQDPGRGITREARSDG
jgi:hypothetical protein